MKKWCIVLWLCFSAVCTSVFADAGNELQSRLNKVSSFYADFIQTVTSADNTLIQQGKGKLWVKHPNLFNWHMTNPDENILISDGKTLWYYNPLIEQVTANWLNSTTANTPFMLIARNHSDDWKQYTFVQKGDDFALTPKSAENRLTQFNITVTPAGVIRRFSAVEKDGQHNTYELKSYESGAIDGAKFTFILPEGVTLDDQRQ